MRAAGNGFLDRIERMRPSLTLIVIHWKQAAGNGFLDRIERIARSRLLIIMVGGKPLLTDPGTDLTDYALPKSVKSVASNPLSAILAPQPVWNEQPLSIDLVFAYILGRKDTVIFQAALAKIDQQTNRATSYRQIANHLCQVTVIQTLQGLDLHDNLPLNHKIWNIKADQLFSCQAIMDFILLLRFERQAVLLETNLQIPLIDALAIPWA